jgi:hypothetical protein
MDVTSSRRGGVVPPVPRIGLALFMAATMAVGFAVFASPAGAAASGKATVTVIHGLPHFVADVYVDGKLLLNGFEPEAAAGPLELAPGTYHLAIRDVGASSDAPPALAATVELRAGHNYTAAAHLSPGDGVALSLFDNDISPIPLGKSRLVVRDLAAAPPLNVQVDGTTLFAGLRSSRSRSSVIGPGAYRIGAQADDGSSVTIPATPVELSAGEEGFVYVIGSAQDGTLDLMFQSVNGLSVLADGVQAGSGGMAAPPGFPRWAIVLMILAGVSIAASGVALRQHAVDPSWRGEP